MSTAEPNPFASEDPDGPPVDTNNGSALRKFAEEQKTLVKQLQQQLAEAQKQIATRNAADIFTKLGITDKVRKFYTGEPTEDAIKQWWTENAEVFGVEPAVGNDPTLSDAQQQHQQAIDNVQQAALIGQDRPGAVTREGMQQTRSNLLNQKTSSMADLDAALKAFGVPDLPAMGPQF